MSVEVLTQQDFTDFVEGLEAEFQREFVARVVDSDRDRVLIVGVMTDKIDSSTIPRYSLGVRKVGRYRRGRGITNDAAEEIAHSSANVGWGR